MILFLKLLLAHLVGDFILQPDNWVAEKELKKHKSNKLYWHVLLHFLLIMLLVWDLSFTWIAVVISILHGVTDFLKLCFQRDKTKRIYFFIDQSVHIAVIFLATVYWENIYITFDNFLNAKVLLLTTAILFLTTPSSLIVKIFISKWTDYTKVKTDVLQTDSLLNAGKIIGILERVLIFTFILIDHWEAVGFLITAKSVFRFSDLKQAQDRKLTEYILIGTLSSFSIAIACGILVKYYLQHYV